jgi:hypothetical protein
MVPESPDPNKESSSTQPADIPLQAAQQAFPSSGGNSHDRPPSQAPTKVPVNPAPAVVHDQLAQRIMAIQKERRSRWRKVLDFLLRR